MLATSWSALASFIVVSLIGVRIKAIPQFVGLGVLLAPIVAKLSRQPAATVNGLAAIAALIIAKRLLANEPPAPDADRSEVLLNRLLYDRDTAERDAWVAHSVQEA